MNFKILKMNFKIHKKKIKKNPIGNDRNLSCRDFFPLWVDGRNYFNF